MQQVETFPVGTVGGSLVSAALVVSHSDVLRGLSRVRAPQTSAESSRQKHRPITAHFQIWEECTLDLENFRARLSSRKDQKGLER